MKWGARVLRVRSVPREEVWASAGVVRFDQGQAHGGASTAAEAKELQLLEPLLARIAQKHFRDRDVPLATGVLLYFLSGLAMLAACSMSFFLSRAE